MAGDHDIFSASSTATWLECSWSARNAVANPPKKAETIIAAEAGTEHHEEMEAGEKPDVEHFLAQLEPGTIHREMRVRLTSECGGTLDILNRPRERVATLLDGKFGKWDVDAKDNKQMFTYAACLLGELPHVDWWRFVIYQPNGLDEKPWKQWVHHRSEVEAHRARVLAALSDRSPPKPGPQCRWCPAWTQCPATTTDAGFVMGAISRRPEDLTPEELVRLLRLIRALGDVKPVYDDILTAKLKLGYAAPGATLKQSRSFRAWNDERQAAEYLFQHYGAKGIKPQSPAQAEKLGLAGKQYASIGAHKAPGELKANY